MPPQPSPARHWVFTLNNPDLYPDEIAQTLEDQGYEYAVFQMEEGENGTPHYQGYVIFQEKVRLTVIRQLFDQRAHWEVAKGSPTQNKAYCTKLPRIGEPSELGDFPETAGKGARTDLTQLHSALQAGLSSKDYANKFFPLFVRYPKLVQNYEFSQIVARANGCEVHATLLIGLGGTGKSRLASRLADELELGPVYRHSLGQWWDGYRGERVAVFDDFRGSSLSFTDFKRVFDRYALRVQVKGTSCDLAATHFFITTNTDPLTWWKEEVTAAETIAITRRFTRVLFFREENKFFEFANYRDYAIAVLTPLRDGEVQNLPPQQEVYY